MDACPSLTLQGAAESFVHEINSGLSQDMMQVPLLPWLDAIIMSAAA